jgi:hypothetical protein
MDRSLRSRETLARTDGVTGESACPTLQSKDLRAGWGRLFRLPSDSFTATYGRGSEAAGGNAGPSGGLRDGPLP